jgi:hypothetical protein
MVPKSSCFESCRLVTAAVSEAYLELVGQRDPHLKLSAAERFAPPNHYN